MKKLLSILSLSILGCFSTAEAQVYSDNFNTLASGWTTPASYTLAATGGKLHVTMIDSIGPQQLPYSASPGADWDAFQYVFASPVNMAQNCKCITFDIDNTGNAEITYAVQAQDINHVAGTNNKYTDQTNFTVPAGYVGSVTINFSGKFENYYGYPAAGGKLDSTQISQLNFQPLGSVLTASPWNKKFKGNYTMDNLKVSGPVTATQSAQANVSSANVYPNPTSDMAHVELKLFSPSSVKVTLSDMMGKEVMTISESTSDMVSKDFSVSSLRKGVYTVNYFIDGAAAKSELLMVK